MPATNWSVRIKYRSVRIKYRFQYNQQCQQPWLQRHREPRNPTDMAEPLDTSRLRSIKLQ
eukprot:2332931-Pyramimonas_sp.AAC.1